MVSSSPGAGGTPQRRRRSACCSARRRCSSRTRRPSTSQSRDDGPVRGLLLSFGFLLIVVGLVASVVSHGRPAEEEPERGSPAAAADRPVRGRPGRRHRLGGRGPERQRWRADLGGVAAAVRRLPADPGPVRHRRTALPALRHRGDRQPGRGRGAWRPGSPASATPPSSSRVGKVVDSRTSGFWLSLLGHRPGRHGVPAATPLGGPPREPVGLRRPGPALRGAVGLQQPTGRDAVAGDPAARPSPTRPGGPSRRAGPWRASRWRACRPGRPTGAGPTSRAPTRTWSRSATGAPGSGTIAVWIPKGRPLQPSDTRLLTALSEQAAVAFRNVAMESQLAAHVAELDRRHARALRRPARGSSRRTTRRAGPSRRPSRATCCRDLLPCPMSSSAPAGPLLSGRPTNGVDLLVTATNEALESLRELTRGVFPTQLARSGLEPALRALLARHGLASALRVGASAAGQRFSPRVEAAVYFCCAEASRSASDDVSSVELRLTGARPRAGGRRSIAGGGRPAGDRGPGRRGRPGPSPPHPP